jgi:hypothetical protein
MQDEILLLGVYCLKTGYLKGEGFNLVFPEVFENLRRKLRSYGNEEDGGFLTSGKIFSALFFLAATRRRRGAVCCCSRCACFCHYLPLPE